MNNLNISCDILDPWVFVIWNEWKRLICGCIMLLLVPILKFVKIFSGTLSSSSVTLAYTWQSTSHKLLNSFQLVSSDLLLADLFDLVFDLLHNRKFITSSKLHSRYRSDRMQSATTSTLKLWGGPTLSPTKVIKFYIRSGQIQFPKYWSTVSLYNLNVKQVARM